LVVGATNLLQIVLFYIEVCTFG